MVGGMGMRIQAFLERYFSDHGRLYIGFSYIILSQRVFRMFELHRVFLVGAMMREVTLEKRLYTRTHATNHIAHPQLQALERHLGVSLLVGCMSWRCQSVSRALLQARVNILDGEVHTCTAVATLVSTRVLQLYRVRPCTLEYAYTAVYTYILQPVHGVSQIRCPCVTQLQILELPVLELNSLYFHLFLIFHQPKMCFPHRQKVLKFNI